LAKRAFSLIISPLWFDGHSGLWYGLTDGLESLHIE
jgi:hypothetical protein